MNGTFLQQKLDDVWKSIHCRIPQAYVGAIIAPSGSPMLGKLWLYKILWISQFPVRQKVSLGGVGKRCHS